MTYNSRHYFTVLLLTISLQSLTAQTLFTYGNKSVDKGEFLRAYNKNNTVEKPSERSYREYLDLYTRFKMKVEAASDARLDTELNQKTELQGFRNQVLENYMKDEASMNVLISEAFERSKKDIHLSHIYIPVKKDASEQLISQAKSRIDIAYEELKKGKPFQDVVSVYSVDPARMRNKGDIGFITVFTLPYNLENVAYSTPAGKYSKPFRSRSGFHILKNTGERRAAGKIHAAQILFAFPPEATEGQKQMIRLRADSVYSLLQKGADFKRLATQFSNDNLTYQSGGEMPTFGVGRYDPVFEKAAFALSKDGDISKPVVTAYGYHIIKRLRRMPVENKMTREYSDAIKEQVSQSDRMEVSRNILLKKVKQQTGFKQLPVDEKNLLVFTDSILQNKAAPDLPGLKNNSVLFTFTKGKVTVGDWQNYLGSVKSISSSGTEKSKAVLFDQFIETTVLEYYQNHLEEFNKEFADQVTEFKEGNLLFGIMQRKIWDAAAADSIGLKNYYEQHKQQYWWESSADAIIFVCGNEKAAQETKDILKQDFSGWRKLSEKSNGVVQADSGRFELSQIPVAERTNFQPGLITANTKNETDSSFNFAYIINLHKDRQPRGFEDARGFVINDYQNYLEDQWIVELKKKYPLKVNEEVFKSLPR